MRELIESLERHLTEGSIPKFTKFVDKWETDDYPSGRHRVRAVWTVENKGKKSRACRVTHHPKTGRPSKPKCTTYSLATKIGIGSDGRAYIVQLTEYSQVVIWPGTMKTTTYLHDGDPGFAELKKVLVGDIRDRTVQSIIPAPTKDQIDRFMRR